MLVLVHLCLPFVNPGVVPTAVSYQSIWEIRPSVFLVLSRMQTLIHSEFAQSSAH